jgi:hypothetical protein
VGIFRLLSSESDLGQAVATAIPDFSGIWSHPSLPGFEPPVSGPGPVLNKSRLPTGQSNPSRYVGDYTNPILKPQAAEEVKKHGEISLAAWSGGLSFYWSHWWERLQPPP